MGVMPAGKVHTLVNVTLLGSAWLLHLAFRTPTVPLNEALLFSATYLAGTYLMTPDLDLAAGHVDAKTNWGPLGFLWVPFGMLSKHRGRNHSWFFGPAVRLLYLAALLAPLLYLLRLLAVQLVGEGAVLHWQATLQNASVPWSTLMALLLGYFVSQWIHLILDGEFPWAPGRL